MVTVVGRRTNSFFQERLLKFEFWGGIDEEGHQVTFSNGSNHIALEGFRANVDISMFNGIVQPELNVSIYNMPETIANQISTLMVYDKFASYPGNQIIVYASADRSKPDEPFYIKIYQGIIATSYTDYNAAPEIVTHISAQTLSGMNMVPFPALSYAGKVSAYEIVQAIVANSKTILNGGDAIPKELQPIVEVINQGVHTALENPHFVGDMISQLDQCAYHADFSYTIQNQILYMRPKGAVSETPFKSNILLTSATGMIGYPQYSSNGMIVRSIFKPYILFGEPIEIQSLYKPANGIWSYMVSMRHSLSCLDPSGTWETQMELTKERIKTSIGNP